MPVRYRVYRIGVGCRVIIRVALSAGHIRRTDAARPWTRRSCLMPEPEPGVVEITGELQIAPDLVVVPNRHLDLVPNIGVIGGTHSVLVETGMGPRNAEKVLTFAAG